MPCKGFHTARIDHRGDMAVGPNQHPLARLDSVRFLNVPIPIVQVARRSDDVHLQVGAHGCHGAIIRAAQGRANSSIFPGDFSR